MFTDHNWGPRVLLFLSPEDQARLDAVIIAHLDELIPETFLGWPTRIKLHDANAPDADAEGRRPAALRVEAHSLRSWVRGWLGARADAELDWRVWLGLPEQALLEGRRVQSIATTTANLALCATASPIFRGTSGFTRSPANGFASDRSKRSWVGAAMSATTLAHASSPRDWRTM
jgi:hypothetical protein